MQIPETNTAPWNHFSWTSVIVTSLSPSGERTNEVFRTAANRRGWVRASQLGLVLFYDSAYRQPSLQIFSPTCGLRKFPTSLWALNTNRVTETGCDMSSPRPRPRVRSPTIRHSIPRWGLHAQYDEQPCRDSLTWQWEAPTFIHRYKNLSKSICSRIKLPVFLIIFRILTLEMSSCHRKLPLCSQVGRPLLALVCLTRRHSKTECFPDLATLRVAFLQENSTWIQTTRLPWACDSWVLHFHGNQHPSPCFGDLYSPPSLLPRLDGMKNVAPPRAH